MPLQKDEGVSPLHEASERLYAPGQGPASPYGVLSPSASLELPHVWGSKSFSRIGGAHHVRFAARFFFIAVGFFVVATLVAAFFFFTGANTVSVDNVSLTIQGPTTIPGGDIVPLSIIVTNKNPTTLEHATLEVDFPEGSRSATDITAAYQRYNEDLGSLSPGQTVERSIQAVLFGSQGSQVLIPVSVSFGTARSNAVFVKRETYPIVISTAPLSVSVESVSETVSGKPLTFKATVRSNATTPVEGIVLGVQYPAGFSLTSSSVTPVGTNFPLGRLQPGGVKTVTLTGTLTGQDSEERVFHFTVGTAKAANDPSLAVSYMTQEAGVIITAPFLATSVTVNGSSTATPAVAPGATVTVGVLWTNALSVSVANADIQVTLAGAALDPASVQIQKGFYRSADRTIIFNRDTDPSLATLAPGAKGQGTFTFSTVPNAPRNSSVTLTLSIAGERVGQAGVPEQVVASGSKIIKVVSAVSFTASALHASGSFTNTGPIPPVAENATSYTVLWSLVNAGNDLADGAVTATLPAYVAFSGLTLPADGSISYDTSSRTVSWKAGDIAGGSSRQASFQVILTPSTTQKGSAPALTNAPTLKAFDRFAQTQITTQGLSVTTETPSDPGYTANKATVQ